LKEVLDGHPWPIVDAYLQDSPFHKRANLSNISARLPYDDSSANYNLGFPRMATGGYSAQRRRGERDNGNILQPGKPGGDSHCRSW
jgi:hypothetical protein